MQNESSTNHRIDKETVDMLSAARRMPAVTAVSHNAGEVALLSASMLARPKMGLGATEVGSAFARGAGAMT